MKKLLIGSVCMLGLGLGALCPAADFDGDGVNDVGVFRPSTGLWSIQNVTRAYLGSTGDDPVPGDYDGDGVAEIAVFRPSSGLWSVLDLTRAYLGGAGDEPLGGLGGGGGFWRRNGYGVWYGGSAGIGMQPSLARLTVASDSGITNPQLTLFEEGDDYSRLSFYNSMSSFFTLAARPAPSDLDARLHFYYSGIGNILSLTGDGMVGIGQDSPTAALEVSTDNPSEYALRLMNDGNDANRYGLRVQCGSDDGVGTSYLAFFADGNNTQVGSITHSGGNVSYNTFTAEHNAAIPEKDDRQGGYPYGTVVSLRGTRANPERPRQDSYTVEPSTKALDKEVFGVYAGKLPDQENLHSIYAIGDGHILVTREGGDIAAGDYLTTSSKPGLAMRQEDDLRHAYTVAKALRPVDWSAEEGESVLIPCTYQTQ